MNDIMVTSGHRNAFKWNLFKQRSVSFIVNFEQISHINLLFVMLTLSKWMPTGERLLWLFRFCYFSLCCKSWGKIYSTYYIFFLSKFYYFIVMLLTLSISVNSDLSIFYWQIPRGIQLINHCNWGITTPSSTNQLLQSRYHHAKLFLLHIRTFMMIVYQLSVFFILIISSALENDLVWSQHK